MTNAAIAADFDEPLDVHGDFTPEVALYLAVMINVLSQFVNIRFGQILDPDVGVNAGLAKEVSPISTLFSLGRSTPLIRAI